MLDMISSEIEKLVPIDALYLFGSRSDGSSHDQSDYDIGVLFRTHIGVSLEAYERVQRLKYDVESTLKLYDLLDFVDVELPPLALQYAVIKGKKLIDHNPVRSIKFENSILSKIDEDF